MTDVGFDQSQYGEDLILRLDEYGMPLESTEPADPQATAQAWGLTPDEVRFLADANEGVNIYDSFTLDRILDKWAQATGNERMAELNAGTDLSFDERQEHYTTFSSVFWSDCVSGGLIHPTSAPPPPPTNVTEGPYEIPWTQTQEYRDQVQAYQEEQARRQVEQEQRTTPFQYAQQQVVDAGEDTPPPIDINPADHADDIAARNAANLKATPDGGQVSYVQRAHVVLIGGGHDDQLQLWVQQGGDDAFNGVITIGKGGVFDRGTLHVSTMGRAGRRGEFEAAIAEISKKAVTWAD